MKKWTFIIVLLISMIATTSMAIDNRLSVIPYPQKVEILKGRQVFNTIKLDTSNVNPQLAKAIVAQLHRFVPELIVHTDAKGKGVLVTLQQKAGTDGHKEAYKLKIEKNKVTISYGSDQGCFYAFQTLIQLIEKGKKQLSIPNVQIEDWPNFSIRGFMHDVGRNFQTIESLKQQLDVMALYKINTFHWHLTDHPAWRIESKAYPILNDPRYQRKGRDEGKFYTYNEIRDLISYAKARSILVIPELDVPGHSAYFKAAFEFTMESPQGMEVLEKCFREFFNEIPATDCPYIHLGSDEVHIPNPKEFIEKMEKLVLADGRIPIVWNPGLKASHSTINQIWKDEAFSSEDVNRNLDLASPFFDSSVGYLNYYDPLILLQRILLNKACGKPQEDSLALGGILCCWPDVKVADKRNIFRHNPVWPATLAFAERYWRGGELPKMENSNLLNMEEAVTRSVMLDFERRLAYNQSRFFANEPFPWSANAQVKWNITVPFEDSTATTTLGIDDIKKKSQSWVTSFGGTIDLEAIRRVHSTSKGSPLMAFAYAIIESDKDKTVDCWVGFETPARSNRFYSGIPQQGSWDGNGGDVWVNGQRLAPPIWSNPGEHRVMKHTWGTPDEEIPYIDEEFYWTRSPVKVNLKKGVNFITIKSPKAYNSQRWTFSFIPLNTEGLIFK